MAYSGNSEQSAAQSFNKLEATLETQERTLQMSLPGACRQRHRSFSGTLLSAEALRFLAGRIERTEKLSLRLGHFEMLRSTWSYQRKSSSAHEPAFHELPERLPVGAALLLAFRDRLGAVGVQFGGIWLAHAPFPR